MYDRGELIDLSHAALSFQDFANMDLRHANLQGADLKNAELRSANLSGADLRGAKGLKTLDVDNREGLIFSKHTQITKGAAAWVTELMQKADQSPAGYAKISDGKPVDCPKSEAEMQMLSTKATIPLSGSGDDRHAKLFLKKTSPLKRDKAPFIPAKKLPGDWRSNHGSNISGDIDDGPAR